MRNIDVFCSEMGDLGNGKNEYQVKKELHKIGTLITACQNGIGCRRQLAQITTSEELGSGGLTPFDPG